MQQDLTDAAAAERLAGGVLTIDLDALAANWRTLAALAPGAACAAVVKANAYGIGIEAAVPALVRAGCRTFFVAHPDEGRRARAVAPEATVYVLNGLPPGAAAEVAALGLRPVLGSAEEYAAWAAFASDHGRPAPAALHVDTGMNRLGLPLAEVAALAERHRRTPAFEIALVMSHLVAAEEPDRPINAAQVERFERIRTAFAGTPASLANSSGIFLPQRPHYDLVRPGYALYGGNPQPGRTCPVKPVVRLEVRIIQVRDVSAGETVGYNGRWTAGRPTRIATLCCGYADGMPRAAGRPDGITEAGGGVAIVDGIRCPFAGAVSMDLITIDVSTVPRERVNAGDTATLIGGPLGLEEVGARAGTIGYEMLTSLGRRFARRYVGNGGG